MKIFVAGLMLLLVSGCASTASHEEAVKLQVESNNTQKQILKTLLDMKADQAKR